MGIGEDLDLLKTQMSVMYSYFDTQRKAGGKPAKLPKKVLRQVRRGLKKNKILVPFFGSNKGFEFLTGIIDGGLVRVGEDSYELDPTAVYYWRKGRVPVYGIIQWRLPPVGGKPDLYQGLLSVGGEEAENIAKALNITNYAQRTIIRGIQEEEVGADKKKKKKMPWILWVLLGVGVVFVLSRILKGGGG